MLAYIRGTATETGLKVKAFLLEGTYQTGVKITNKQVRQWNLVRHTICPKWNYTIKPRTIALVPLRI